MALEKELQTYKDNLSTLDADEGKFVLIQGEDIVGIYTAYEDALKAGYEKFGVNTPFLVKKIQVVEQVQVITRFLDASCHTSQ